MTTASSPQPIYSFGTFRLFPRTGVLQDSGRDVRLGSRAVELLAALVERGGEVAPSDELIARVWPTTTVDEQNLRVQIAGLRKTLADGHGDERFIATAPGRGYRFVAPVATDTFAGSDAHFAPAPQGNLPAALTRLFGRAEVIDDLRRRLADERLVSVVGPGGVGKTSVAVALAHQVADGAAWFADLAPVSEAALIPTAVLEAFGLAASPDNMLEALAHRLDGKDVLLVLDNCEHLIEACASIAEALLGAIRGLRLLATSREPLRAAGEWVLRLSALETPDVETSLERASSCSAVQLFVQRAASGNVFSLTEETLPSVVDICRRLDGIPLALELAAAAVSTLGVRGVAQRLREQTELPGLGRRTASARQATLRATLDWSYQLLSPGEQRTLRRLAAFQGAFTLESAAAVAGPQGAGEAPILALLAGLAEKSLLSVDLSHEEARYRLLQTTRSFALERLTPREMGATRARHAREMRRLAEATDRAWGMGDGEEARRDSADLVDDLSAAIEWALSPLGDTDTAVDLIVAATPLRRRLSLLSENAKQVEQALDKVRALSPPNPTAEMRLLGSYGLALDYRYETRDWIIPAAERLLALAEELGDAEHLIVGAWARIVYAYLLGDNATFRRCADQMFAAATPTIPETYRALAHAIRSQIFLQDGDLAEARRATEAGLNLVADGQNNLHVARLGLDPGVYLYDGLVRICWAQGRPNQSLAAARACVAHFRQLSHAQSLMYALTDVAAVAALLVGELDAAAAFLGESQRLCEERGEQAYHGRSQDSMLAMLRFARTGIADRAAAAIVAPGSTDVLLARPALAVRIAEALGQSREPELGLAALNTVNAYAAGANSWLQPELLRVRAALLRKAGTPASEAEALLRQALGRAREIGALTLELRAATTLAELLSDDGRPAEGVALLTDIIDRMPEGREAADYRRAASLRDTLSPG